MFDDMWISVVKSMLPELQSVKQRGYNKRYQQERKFLVNIYGWLEEVQQEYQVWRKRGECDERSSLGRCSYHLEPFEG